MRLAQPCSHLGLPRGLDQFHQVRLRLDIRGGKKSISNYNSRQGLKYFIWGGCEILTVTVTTEQTRQASAYTDRIAIDTDLLLGDKLVNFIMGISPNWAVLQSTGLALTNGNRWIWTELYHTPIFFFSDYVS